MAIHSVSHSNCINTFNHDTLTVIDSTKDLTRIRQPTKIMIPPPTKQYATDATYAKYLIKYLNSLLYNIVQFKLHHVSVYQTYRFVSKKIHIFLSPCLREALGVSQVITSYDEKMSGIIALNSHTLDAHECYIILIPVDASHETIVIKDNNEVFSVIDLVKRFQSRLCAKYPDLSVELTQSKSHIVLRQSEEFGKVVILSKGFNTAMGFNQNGFTHGSYTYNLKDMFTDKWTLNIYSLESVPERSNGRIIQEFKLPPKLFQNTSQLCQHINKIIDYKEINFEAEENVAHLTINSNDLRIEFSKDVQDILAFNQSKYQGTCNIRGSDVISLTRCINYFYIYSNISEYIRVGDTEAPLLAHFPFNPKSCRTITERVFKQPSYVKVKGNQITQIDIGIYDDAGKLIPFHRDALTSIRLHFRRT